VGWYWAEQTECVVAKGRIIRFSESQGYGFITPDDGGRDVFVHANVLEDNGFAPAPGAVVEFESVEGERGLKAQWARVIERAPARSANAPAVRTAERGEDGEVLCDVLTPDGLGQELIGLFLDEVPSLTGTQMVALRTALVRLGRRHGWVDE
jgi:cold shock protein